MKLLKIILIAMLVSSCTGSKMSVTEPNADHSNCNFPTRIGFINDYCNFLTAQEIESLEKTIADYYAKTQTEIIIVIEDSKKSHSRKFHCPMNIAKKWQLANVDTFDDIFIVISKKRTYIDLSYGLNANIKLNATDRQRIIYEKMIPSFRKKQYYEGLKNGIAYIIEHRKSI